jgi:hypothetical protein
VIFTVVPPVVEPEVGVMELITGAGSYPKVSELSVPPTVKLEAGVVPNFTLVVPVRPVPVIVILSLPDRTPVVGNTASGAGAAT